MNILFPLADKEIVAWRAVEHPIYKNFRNYIIAIREQKEDQTPDTQHQLIILKTFRKFGLIKFVRKEARYIITLQNEELFMEFHKQLEALYIPANLREQKKEQGVVGEHLFVNLKIFKITGQKYDLLAYFAQPGNYIGNGEQIKKWVKKDYSKDWVKETKIRLNKQYRKDFDTKSDILVKASRGYGYKLANGIDLRKV